MSLRSRLIIAFFLLSVVPLSAVTLLSYRSSVNAFERAAQREAAESAQDISRRMRILASDVGRRMDRVFLGGMTPGDGQSRMDLKVLRDRMEPILGDTAALVDRLEFRPAPEAHGTHVVAGVLPPAAPAPARRPGLRRDRPRNGPPPAVEPGVPPPPPPAPPVVVVDVQRLIEEARQASEAGRVDTEKLAALQDAQRRIIGNEQALKALEAAISRETARAASAGGAARPAPGDAQVAVSFEGRTIEVPITESGRVLGKANATLNLDRALRTVLAFARRDQGEIPFAIDPKRGLHTPDRRDEERLHALQVESIATTGGENVAKRAGDWLVVAHKDPGGVTFGIARPLGASLREIRRAAVRNLSLGMLVILVAFVGIVPISHRMTQHLSTLNAGVRQLAGGDFRTRVPVRSRDEFGSLAVAFNQMAEDLERNQAAVVEQERLRRELELSRQIQTEMLPRAPLRSGPAEIAGISIPAREVGGDFFNYFVLPDGRLALLVGDVSGKGVSAALLMANVQATLRARMPHETDLAVLADRLDRELEQNTPKSVYVTLFLGILELDGRTLRYVNAGHNPQFVLRVEGGLEPLSSTGLPIALYAGHGYRESRVELHAGDLLFFYTDGLVETENEAGEMFSAERLEALLAAEHLQTVDRLLQHVENSVAEFRGAAEPFDDATMMALRISDRTKTSAVAEV